MKRRKKKPFDIRAAQQTLSGFLSELNIEAIERAGGLNPSFCTVRAIEALTTSSAPDIVTAGGYLLLAVALSTKESDPDAKS